LLGAAAVIVGDMIPERLKQAKSFGCETIDVKKTAKLGEAIDDILGVPEVDCAVDCVGFEARGHGKDASHEAPATVLNSIMEITRAGGALGIPGLYVTATPAASTPTPKSAISASASAWAGPRAMLSSPASAPSNATTAT